MLSIREMLRVVSKEEIYQAVRDQPLLGLSWITSAPAWGSPPTPTSFRFTYASHYRNVVRIVEEELPNVHVKNPHPFLHVRAGRSVREWVARNTSARRDHSARHERSARRDHSARRNHSDRHDYSTRRDRSAQRDYSTRRAERSCRAECPC